jgi:hypothetical protein
MTARQYDLVKHDKDKSHERPCDFVDPDPTTEFVFVCFVFTVVSVLPWFPSYRGFRHPPPEKLFLEPFANLVEDRILVGKLSGFQF